MKNKKTDLPLNKDKSKETKSLKYLCYITKKIQVFDVFDYNSHINAIKNTISCEKNN